MRLTARPLALLVAFAAGSLVAGCGSSSSDGAKPTTTTTTTAPAPTKVDYIKRANKICADISGPLREKMNAVNLDDPAAVDEAVTTVLLPAEREQLAQVRALGYPEGDKDLLETGFAAADKEFDRIEANPSLALGTGSDAFKAQAAILVDYGITECAGG